MSDYNGLKKLAEEMVEPSPFLHDESQVARINRGRELLALIAELERVVALNHQQFGMALRKNQEVADLKAENERLLARDTEHVRQFNELSDFRQKTVEGFDRVVAALGAENEALRKDAERYRWLRAQHWDSSAICCVVDPKVCTKLGSYCPSLELLDQAVDAGIKLGKEKKSE